MSLNRSRNALISNIVLVVMVVTIATLADGQSSGQQSPADDAAVRVPSAVVKIANTVAVPAEHSGVLTTMKVREGDILKAGALIANINDAELRIRYERAKLEYEIAKLKAANDVDIRFAEKSSEVAQADVSRSQRANAKVANSIPGAKLERQILERDRTLLQREQADRDYQVEKLKSRVTENEIKLSELLLEKTKIRSPVDGMVVSIEKRRGEWVEPSETVVRIARVDRLRVEGFVSARDAGKIKIGLPVSVKFTQDWLKETQFEGNVVFVSPEANPVNSQVLIWAEINDKENQLVAGIRGEILINTEKPAETGLSQNRISQ